MIIGFQLVEIKAPAAEVIDACVILQLRAEAFVEDFDQVVAIGHFSYRDYVSR